MSANRGQRWWIVTLTILMILGFTPPSFAQDDEATQADDATTQEAAEATEDEAELDRHPLQRRPAIRIAIELVFDEVCRHRGVSGLLGEHGAADLLGRVLRQSGWESDRDAG